MTRWLAALAALALASPAAAAPKGAPAKKEFDRGVAAYTKGNFAVASEALGASFKLEADVETLFAWAQSERQLERCDKAIELFEKLLDFNLPAENKKVVAGKIDECKAIIAAKQPEKKPEKKPEKQLEKQPDKQPDKQLEKQPGAGAAGGADTDTPLADKPPPGPARSPWWTDPLGDVLIAVGAGGVGVGAYFLWSAKGASDDLKNDVPKNETEFQDTKDRADSYGKIGSISAIAGGVLIVGGIVRYATRGGGADKERATVTGWLSPDGGGVAAIGRF